MKSFWDDRYSQKMYIYGKAPNAFFASQLMRLPKGSILLPAEGEGRNAVYAAIKGWKVQAFDFSEAAKSKAMQLAQSYDVQIDYNVIEASAYQPQKQYNVVALVFTHFAGEEREQLFKKLQNSIAPEGYLIMEVFSKNQLGRESGGPKDADLLYSKSEIQALFPDLDFQILEETKTELDEGIYHQGEAAVIQMLAQKLI